MDSQSYQIAFLLPCPAQVTFYAKLDIIQDMSQNGQQVQQNRSLAALRGNRVQKSADTKLSFFLSISLF